MSLLIDGYNLLNRVGIVGRGAGASSLERSRRALLNFLAESLDAEQIRRTTVVFDAAHAPRGRPHVLKHRGLTVRFSAGYADADALIEELIRAETSPRQLTVVSSDHRLHRAARRRKATPVDSDAWFAQITRRRTEPSQTPERGPAKPPAPLSEDEVAQWLERFGGQSALEEFVAATEAETLTPAAAAGEAPPDEVPPDKLTPEEAAAIGDPFPPGYGEDLLDDNSEDDRGGRFAPRYWEEGEDK